MSSVNITSPAVPGAAPAVIHDWNDLRHERERLMTALGGVGLDVVDRLYAHGLRSGHVAVLEWLPAVDVCWLDGADESERHALRLQYISDDRGSDAGLAVLDGWLRSRPAPELVAAGRMALGSWLGSLDGDARDEMAERIVGRCEAVSRAAGGDFGVSAVSPVERQHIERVKRYLALPA